MGHWEWVVIWKLDGIMGMGWVVVVDKKRATFLARRDHPIDQANKKREAGSFPPAPSSGLAQGQPEFGRQLLGECQLLFRGQFTLDPPCAREIPLCRA